MTNIKPRIDPQTLSILQTVKENSPDQPVYLVGGAVRDLLLNREIKDLDFVVEGGSLELAQSVRQELRGVGFTLDDERKTGRVILHQGKVNEIVLDFVSFFGDSLAEDLKNRDFSINAMALALDELESLIDPVNGQEDLLDGVLRCASETSLLMDPLRVLRGVRIALEYDLEIEGTTLEKMRIATNQLDRISGERIRDELFKILQLDGRIRAFAVLAELGVLDIILPGVEDLGIGRGCDFRILNQLESIFGWIEGDEKALGSGKAAELLKAHLTAYREPIKRLIDGTIQGGRSRKGLTYLAGIYYDFQQKALEAQAAKLTAVSEEVFAKDAVVDEISARLALGTQEKAYLEKMISNRLRLRNLADAETVLSNIEIYRYFLKLGQYGIDLALLSLADLLAINESSSGEAISQKELQIVARLMEAWFNKQDSVVSPKKIIDGNDLSGALAINPGPVFGKLLQKITEAQVMGSVTNKAEGLELAKKILRDWHGEE